MSDWAIDEIDSYKKKKVVSTDDLNWAVDSADYFKKSSKSKSLSNLEDETLSSFRKKSVVNKSDETLIDFKKKNVNSFVDEEMNSMRKKNVSVKKVDTKFEEINSLLNNLDKNPNSDAVYFSNHIEEITKHKKRVEKVDNVVNIDIEISKDDKIATSLNLVSNLEMDDLFDVHTQNFNLKI